MAKKFPLHPKHPERICWGCDKYCPIDDLGCGNGADRTQHPIELMGEDWYLHGDWQLDLADEAERDQPVHPATGQPE
jgi:hypothetical protein